MYTKNTVVAVIMCFALGTILVATIDKHKQSALVADESAKTPKMSSGTEITNPLSMGKIEVAPPVVDGVSRWSEDGKFRYLVIDGRFVLQTSKGDIAYVVGRDLYQGEEVLNAEE